ncbi:oxidoreductase C-terminal domain-containing protein [Streptomyces coelicoflavus]|uniref:oxidoreductase C-terminal domain-containing protein n=1 Tax=Streptomyces coelicoflavus TaxID=285562 RepID=UPI00331DFB40
MARWHHPRFGTSMRVEHRTNAAEQALTVAHNLLHPDRPRAFAPVPYFWTDQYDVRLQAYGHPRGHDEHVVVEGDLTQGRFLVAYRTGDRLSAGLPPRTLRPWREALATDTPWTATAAATAPARSVAPHTAVPATHMEDA